MLHSWVGVTNNRRQSVPFSFSDRSDLWPGHAADTTAGTLDRNDFGSIARGLIAGTLVATEMGWQPVEDLRPGDRVVTFDNGMRPLKAVHVSSLWTTESNAPRGVWPLEVPRRALGNREVIRLLPDQSVLIESDEAEALFGDPFIMVSAGVLDGHKGITRVPPAREMLIVTLEFARDEVVYANGTMLVHCPLAWADTVHSAEELMTVGSSNLYQHLTEAQGRLLVAAMHGADA
ncbi:MAG: Hint domain-containing protein [Pararhodobacter sp.]|nr:Hint domain-containing protein [Pararhodobacter sp.]